jgi:hypothetical protein
MLFPDEARAYVALYSHWDDFQNCPACGDALDGYETTIMRHVRTCKPLIDSTKFEQHACAFCSSVCSTHPDAANPLTYCGDCGRVACPDHRVDDAADRCVDCAATFYAAPRLEIRNITDKTFGLFDVTATGATVITTHATQHSAERARDREQRARARNARQRAAHVNTVEVFASDGSSSATVPYKLVSGREYALLHRRWVRIGRNAAQQVIEVWARRSGFEDARGHVVVDVKGGR